MPLSVVSNKLHLIFVSVIRDHRKKQDYIFMRSVQTGSKKSCRGTMAIGKQQLVQIKGKVMIIKITFYFNACLSASESYAHFLLSIVFNFLLPCILQIFCSTNCYISASPFGRCQRQMTFIPAFFRGELCLELEKRKKLKRTAHCDHAA